jgi:hypothetical protein
VLKVVIGVIALWLLFWAIFYGSVLVAWLFVPIIWLLRRVHLSERTSFEEKLASAERWNTEHPDEPVLIDLHGTVSAMHSRPRSGPVD